MAGLVGRTVASGDAMHTVAVVVANDEGTWLLKRPQDYGRDEIAGLVEAAHARQYAALYERSRVRLANRRLDAPRELPVTPSFNKWSANAPGTTLFLPVEECSALYINILLTVFEEDYGYFLVDDRHGYQPAGLARFARSRGGHLYDDPRAGRVATVEALETSLFEFAAVEQGGILQNLGLTAQALGLGGFPFFAAHPYGWLLALGFRTEGVPFSRLAGTSGPLRWILRALRRDLPVPTALGLERGGAVLLRPYCPPYYPSMREAVLALVDSKFGAGTGTLRDGRATAWRDGPAVQAGIPRCSDRAVEATIAYCEYVHRRYGRFPIRSGPFRTVLAYQAHHVDSDFYDRFYQPEALSATQREHGARWHQAGARPTEATRAK
jgi:hypothetical protein